MGLYIAVLLTFKTEARRRLAPWRRLGDTTRIKLMHQPALKEKKTKTDFCFSSRVVPIRGRSGRLLVSTTQVSITCRSTTVVATIAEPCWILPERGVASMHVPDGWWGRRREGQPFRATSAITSLIHVLFAFGEYTAQCSLAVNSDFVSFLSSACWVAEKGFPL